MKIGDNIRKFRKEKGLTQKDLAEKINKSTITVRKYESNDTLPPIDVLGDISTVLQIPIDFLIGSKLTPIQDKESFCGFMDSQFGHFDPNYESYMEFIQRKINDVEIANKYNKIAIPNGFVSRPNLITQGLAYESLVNLIIYINKEESLFDMDDKTYRYLLMKVCDLLEFELFKLSSENKSMNQNKVPHQESIEKLVKLGIMKEIENNEKFKHLHEENIEKDKESLNKLVDTFGIPKGMHSKDKEDLDNDK